jgi:hypothetical protein
MNNIKKTYQKLEGLNSPITKVEYIEKPSDFTKKTLSSSNLEKSKSEKNISIKKIYSDQDIIIDGRKAWKTLFTQVFDLQQLEDWEKTIPKYGCDCSNFYQKYKKMYPPPENIGFAWKWALKNAVNQKLGQPILSIEEAKAFWANFGVNTDG